MRIFILSCIIVSIISASSCQPESNSSPNSTSESTIAVDGETTITSYKSENGLERWITVKGENRTSEGDVKNGNKHGSWIEYHPNGLIKDVSHYRNGQRSGNRIEVNDRGEVTARSSYMNGKLEGEKIKYNRTRVKAEENYSDGQLSGPRKLYYEDAKSTLQEEGNFLNGKREGTQKWYDQEGNVTIEYEYKNGQKIGS